MQLIEQEPIDHANDDKLHPLIFPWPLVRIAQLVERLTLDQKVAGQFPAGAVREFFSRVDILCCLLFRVCSTPTLLQWHVKKKKKVILPKVQVAGYTTDKHAYTLTPMKLEWADHAIRA